MPTRLVPSAAAAEPVAADSSPPPPPETARRTERASSSPAAPSPGATPPKPDPDPHSEKIGQAPRGETVCPYGSITVVSVSYTKKKQKRVYTPNTTAPLYSFRQT